MQKSNNIPKAGKADWLIAAALAAVSALIYGVSTASFAYPGESAHLMAVWKGLAVEAATPHPLMAFFAGLFGGGNALAPVCGVLAVVSVYLLVSWFVRVRIVGEARELAVSAGRAAGVVAASVFMLTPCVRAAATHLEPRLFAFTWAMGCALLLIPWTRIGGGAACVFPIVAGILWGLGGADSGLFAALSPLMLAALVLVPVKKGEKPYLSVVLFALAAFVAFLVFAAQAGGGVSVVLKAVLRQAKDYCRADGWLVVFLVATLPFLVAVCASMKSFNEKGDWMQWLFNIGLGIVSILAVATPLAPSVRMGTQGVLPVLGTAFVAAVAGYLAAYWWLQIFLKPLVNESKPSPSAAWGRRIACVNGGLLAIVYFFTLIFNLFTFNSSRGEFADLVAGKLLDDLGDRTWLVTDGSLDDHLKLVATAKGRELNVIALNRDLDRGYRDELAALVREKNLAGERNSELVLSLSLGVLSFVQDWFSFDPEAAKSVAIYGAPDLWCWAGRKPVPEFLFFGADESRPVDWGEWKKFNDILAAPKEWGSFRNWKVKNPVDHIRLELRRHLGLIANNRGVWLQDHGKDDEAFDLYDLVLNEIDADNVCALFNLVEMARAKYPRALLKKADYERRLKVIVDDPSRRFRLWGLSTYYGYIRNPDVFVRLGFTWARSGRPGEALSQVRRAIDFVPTDRRTSLMNMMAALYANEDNREKSREVYEQVLAKNADDHDALIGMMRLSLLDGDSAQALAYLERAANAGGDDPRVRVELAMVALMKNDYAKARKLLTAVIDENPSDLRSWSLFAAVTMQMCDATKDEEEKRKLEGELENQILPSMEKQSRGPFDYYVQSTRAFLNLRKSKDVESRRAARDAFVLAAKARPDVSSTQDIVLGLDISLNDTVAAEEHAKEWLRLNRKAPVANYVMGSLALRKNNLDEAETYLRRAADAHKPVVLAMNDLAEVYRRKKWYDEAQRYARLAVKNEPTLYVAWETLGSILMDAGGDLAEAQSCIEKACELSKVNGRAEDIRMVIALARVQIARGDNKTGKATLRRVQSRLGELSEYERKEYEELLKNAR